jgi:transitional endoplasmic reticulum ATPase
MGGVSNIIE